MSGPDAGIRILTVLLLTGCAAAVPPPVMPAPSAAHPAFPAPGTAPDPVGQGVRVEAPASIARNRVEELAAACWLDAELRADAMIVDRQTGAIVATGADGPLLRIAFAPLGALATDVRLTGRALDDPQRRARLVDALGRVLDGATPAC